MSAPVHSSSRRRRLTISLAAAALLVSVPVQRMAAQTTAFTYQGRLTDGAQPANGRYDLQFSLFNAAESGQLMGGLTHFVGTAVSNGVFNVVLDFGPNAFDGSARWIQMDVRTNNPALAYTPLTPRTAVTSVPYAVKSTVAATLDGTVSASQLPPTVARTDVPQTFLGPVSFAERIGVRTESPFMPLTVRGIGESSDLLGFATEDGVPRWHLTGVLGGLNFVESGIADFRLFLAPGGNVGIGTSNPEVRLDVQGSIRSSQELVAKSNIVAGGTVTAGAVTSGGLISGFGGANILGNVTVGGQLSAAGNLISMGRIGIGTTAPKVALEVAGEATVKVLNITGGSDIAEPFDVAGAADAQPGSVVCIDPENPGQLRLSTRAFDRTVAGIISGAGGVNPGLMLTQPGTLAHGRQPVALTGRVYCLVDADAAGAVQAGDLLTTSDTPGHAMRAVDGSRIQGAVIGKAMTSLKSGRGLVLVLVSLQ